MVGDKEKVKVLCLRYTLVLMRVQAVAFSFVFK